MITVSFFIRQNDPVCQKVEIILFELNNDSNIQLVKVDVDQDPALANVYSTIVPVVKIGPYTLHGDITREQLLMTLGAARDRQQYLEKVGDRKYEERYQKARKFSTLDRLTGVLSRHYLALFNLFLGLFIGLPFAAPILMEEGALGPARLIYTVYSPLCHQLAFRSWFLFGEQPFYPRELAGIDGVISYERILAPDNAEPETSVEFITQARDFLGNQQVGYKIALCERDVAMYGGIFLFGLFFSITGRKIRQVPWYWWLALGLIPIGFDGASQLPSLIGGLPNWLPLRESTPFLRSFTGGLFGVLTAWYMYPLIEDTMKDTRAFLVSKQEIISQTRT